MLFVKATPASLVLLALASNYSLACADEAVVVKLAITPAIEPLPSLKYQLLPELTNRRAGNAALLYARAAPDYKPSEEFDKQIADWLELMPAEFDRIAEDANRGIEQHGATLELLQLAARCTACDWHPPTRDQMYLAISLPEVMYMRKFARLVALQARLRLQQRKYGETIKFLQIGYAMARHVGDEPSIVMSLVGLSIAVMMDQVVLDLAQRPGSPSLYWAVSFQPTPLLDVRSAIEGEMYMLETSFPILQAHDEWTTAEWDAAVVRFLNNLPKFAGDERRAGGFGAMLNTAGLLAITTARRQELKQFLRECGEAEHKVKNMGDPQLLATFTRLKYNEYRDRVFRLMVLSYSESLPRLSDAEQQLKDSFRKREEIIPWGGLFLPNVSNAVQTYALADRRRQALRIIEALRLYAAGHEGALPRSLNEIQDVPLPRHDVITDKPFDYVLDDDTARLTLPKGGRSYVPLIYEITVNR